jgi:hypothetical protein
MQTLEVPGRLRDLESLHAGDWILAHELGVG